MTTANTPTQTIHLDGIGDVLALAPELEPVARVAAVGLPTDTWGVVAWPAGADTPTLAARGQRTVVHAQRAAARVADTHHTDRVYLVRRYPTAITVHSLLYPARGHLLGSLPVSELGDLPAGDTGRHVDAWTHAMCSLTGDAANDDRHANALIEAWRLAHKLPATASALDVVNAVTAAPRPPQEYLNAYCAVLSGALHTDAEAAHRSASQHVAAGQLDERVADLVDRLDRLYAPTA